MGAERPPALRPLKKVTTCHLHYITNGGVLSMTKDQYIAALASMIEAMERELQKADDDYTEGLYKGNLQALRHAANLAADLEEVAK